MSEGGSEGWNEGEWMEVAITGIKGGSRIGGKEGGRAGSEGTSRLYTLLSARHGYPHKHASGC